MSWDQESDSSRPAVAAHRDPLGGRTNQVAHVVLLGIEGEEDLAFGAGKLDRFDPTRARCGVLVVLPVDDSVADLDVVELSVGV